MNLEPILFCSPQAPTCQWDGCDKPGVHRAPVGRNAENQFFLFCFEHVKDYNKGYNYFSGLSDGEIARYQKEAITGHRPTWTVGVNKAAKDRAPVTEEASQTLVPAEITTRREEPRTSADVFGTAPAARAEEEPEIDVESVFAKLKDATTKE